MLAYHIYLLYNGQHSIAKRSNTGFHGYERSLRGPRNEGILQKAARDETEKEERRDVPAVIMDQSKATASSLGRHGDVRRQDSREGKIVF